MKLRVFPIALLGVLASLPARADDTAARAQALFEAGRKAYMKGDYQTAYDSQHQAWAIRESFDIAANLGQAELKLGMYRDAVGHLQYALDHFPPSANAQARARLQGTFDDARAKVGAIELDVKPAGASVTVDGTAVTAAQLFVDPGDHVVEATLAGYAPEKRSVPIAAGGTQKVAIALIAESAPAPAPSAPAPVATSTPDQPHAPRPPPDDSRSPVPIYVGGAIVVVGVSAGIGFTLSASSKQSDRDSALAALPGSNPCAAGTPFVAECAHVADLDDSAHSARTLGIVGFAVAGAAAVGTLAYVLWPHSSSTTAIAPMTGSGVAGLAASGSF